MASYLSLTSQAVTVIANGTGVPIAHTKEGTDYYQIVRVETDGDVKQPLRRFLDTVGDGTGTKSAAADHSSAAEEFKLEPGSNAIYRINSLDIIWEDAALGDTGEFVDGAGSGITNGINIQTKDGGGEVDNLLDGVSAVTIKTLGDLFTSGAEITTSAFSAGNVIVRAHFDFVRLCGWPIRVKATSSEYLAVTVNDDLSGLVSLKFLASGYVE